MSGWIKILAVTKKAQTDQNHKLQFLPNKHPFQTNELKQVNELISTHGDSIGS